MVCAGGGFHGVDVRRRGDRLVSLGGPTCSAGPIEGHKRRTNRVLDERDYCLLLAGRSVWRVCLWLAGRQDRPGSHDVPQRADLLGFHGLRLFCGAGVASRLAPVHLGPGDGRSMVLGRSPGDGMLARTAPTETRRGHRRGGQRRFPVHCPGSALAVDHGERLAVDDGRWCQPRRAIAVYHLFRSRIGTLAGRGQERRPQSDRRNLQPGAVEQNHAGDGLFGHSVDRNVGRHLGLHSHLGRGHEGDGNRQEPAFQGKPGETGRGKNAQGKAGHLGEIPHGGTVARATRERLPCQSLNPGHDGDRLDHLLLFGRYDRRGLWTPAGLLSPLPAVVLVVLLPLPVRGGRRYLVHHGGHVRGRHHGRLLRLAAALLARAVSHAGACHRSGALVQFRTHHRRRRDALPRTVRGAVSRRLRAGDGHRHTRLSCGHGPHLVRAGDQAENPCRISRQPDTGVCA